MKCAGCGSKVKERERVGGRCPRCGRAFAFAEPRRFPTQSINDVRFKEAVDRASRDGLFFTERHLWYQLNRDRVWRGERFHPRFRWEAFQGEYLPRWIAANGPVPLLLPRRSVAAESMPRTVPPDVAGFSFDRAVVTDRWETAAMLVANRFHFEHNCAVLSLDGYPDWTAGTVREMLRRNPRLTVFALHDCRSSACLLPLELRKPEWFPGWKTRIVDLGLRPATARRLRLPEQGVGSWESRVSMEIRQVYREDEVTWLAAGRTAELDALRPAHLLRAVYRGIVRAGRYDVLDMPTGWGGVLWAGDLGGADDGKDGAPADTEAVDGFG